MFTEDNSIEPLPEKDLTRRVAWVFFIAFIAVVALAISLGYAFGTPILASFPWAAIALVHRYKNRVRLDPPEPGKMTLTLTAFILPSAAFWAIAFNHNLKYLELIPWAVAISGVLTFTNVQVLAKPVSRWMLLLLFCFHSLYGYKLADAINTRFDTSYGSLYKTSVIEKHRRKRLLSRGAYYYSLTVKPWGPYPEGGTTEISTYQGEVLEPGDDVCMTLYPGVLHIPWFTADFCPRQ